MNIDLIIISIFLIVNLAVGILSSKGIRCFDRFSVGHRAFSSFMIFATLSASFIGGGYTLGNAAKVFEHGMMYAFALLGFSLKEILVARFVAPRMDAHRDCLSIGDIMAKKYGTKAKIITGIFGVLICTGILGAQVGAMGAVFHNFFQMNAIWGIFIGFGVIILYASLGGMRAVVYTDVIQFVFLVIGIPLTLFIGISHVGGVTALIDKTPHSYFLFLNNKNALFLFVSLFITFMLGETLIPPYVQRLLMSKTSRETKRGTLASGLLSIPFFLIAGAIGLVAHALNQHVDPNLALPFVIKTTLPTALRGFVIASILAIIMSSAAGFLNAASVSFVNDVVRPITRDRLHTTTLLKLAKLVTLGVGVGSVIFALTISNVLDILLYAYNFWSPVILIPLMAIILGLNVKKRDFFLGAFGGITAMLIWSAGLHDPFHVNAIIIGVLGNLLFFTASYLASPEKTLNLTSSEAL